MENSNSLLDVPLLKQPFAESFRVFNNPTKILLLGLFYQFQNSRSSFLLLCLSAHLLNAHLAEYLLTKHLTVMSPFVCLMHLLNALLAELSESLVILVLLSELTT
jgi:hypothetical protein